WLIDISLSGELKFRHELIAEYFVAEYFYTIDSRIQPPLPLRPELLDDIGCWNEPVTFWAGLADDPMELAKRFAALGKDNSGYLLETATLSLTCIGVLWAHPQA